VGKDELKNYLIKTAIGVIPLTETFFNKFITSPLKLFDYYSYCIPVIATDLPTTRELIVEGKTGYFFKNEHYKELAERIDELYPNEKIIDKMRLDINNFAQSFLWKNRAIELIKIFKNTAN
jgi:glycosyltransferase involved in cell wall biosynthesis